MDDASRDFRKIIKDFVGDNPSIPQIQFILEDEVEVKEVKDKGLVNYVIRVQSLSRKQSVIIKYGEETLKLKEIRVADKIPLSRQENEFNALQLMNRILPGSVPQPFVYDTKHQIIAMEDFVGIELLADQLAAGIVDIQAAGRIGKLLARMHNLTYCKNVTAQVWQDLLRKFEQPELKALLSLGTFEAAFKDDITFGIKDGGREENLRFLEWYNKHDVREKLSNLFNEKICFLHTDAHWNHYFIFNQDERIALVDFEWVVIGHPCYGMTHTLLGYVIFYHTVNDPASRQTFFEAAKNGLTRLVCEYLSITDIFTTDESQIEFLRNTALFAAVKQAGLARFKPVGNIVSIKEHQRLTLAQSARHLMENYGTITTPPQLAAALLWHPEWKE